MPPNAPWCGFHPFRLPATPLPPLLQCRRMHGLPLAPREFNKRRVPRGGRQQLGAERACAAVMAQDPGRAASLPHYASKSLPESSELSHLGAGVAGGEPVTLAGAAGRGESIGQGAGGVGRGGAWRQVEVRALRS